MGTVRHPSDLTHVFEGPVNITGTFPAYPRSSAIQESLAVYPVDLTSFRIWDAFHTNLPGTSATDDLGLVGGTFGTGVPSLETYDVGALGALSIRGRVMIMLPIEYVAGETVQIRVSAGMVTTVADTTATVDIEAYESAKDGLKTGSDLCTTAATDINSLTFANVDFTITAATLSAGDWLDVRLTVAVNDGATGPEVKGRVGSVELLCDVKG